MEKSDSNNNPLEELSSSVKDYLNLRIDEVKLKLTESLATLFNKIIYFILVIVGGAVAVAFLASAFNLWISAIVDSRIIGSLITAGIFIIIVIILFLFRNKLFTNSMVRLFINIFFDKNDGKNNE